MNKNTILAFSLILLTLFFFNSPVYNKVYEKIFKKPRITHQTNNTQQLQRTAPEQKETMVKKDTVFLKAETAANANDQKKFLTSIKSKTENDKPTGDTLWVENEKIICGITEIGAKIISLQMKDFSYPNNGTGKDSLKRNIDLVANDTLGGANVSINGNDYDNKKFILLSKEKRIKLSKNEKKTIDFIINDDGKNKLIKRFAFDGNSYKIGFDVLSNSLDGKSITVGWKAGITESENKKATTKSLSGVSEPRKVHVYDTKIVTHIQMKKVEKEEETGFYKWAAITSKYFMVAMVADSVKNADLLIDSYDATILDNEGKRGSFLLDYGIQIKRSGEATSEGYWIYAGPSKYLLIRTYKQNFEKVLFGGWEWLLRADIWFPILCEITLWMLVSINGFIKDYGITILILTIITRLITYPLSQSSMKSMSRMKDLQPKINHLRERYKTNARKMNEEVMALYKKEGVNPFNPGCLPMFLQMPILFALFIVLRKAIELRGAHTILLPWVNDLSQPESLLSLTSVFPNGIPMYGNSIALLPIIMAILTFFQNKMTIKDPNQKMMIYFMPIFMLVLFNNFPAGLVLYWTFSNALGIVQQYMLEKSIKAKALTAPVQRSSEENRKKR